jgi:pimeloyl-ACP methyl ester carboxylesterase
MTGVKATRLRQGAIAADRFFIRFDYSGHGLSEGRFEDGVLYHWLVEASTVLALAKDRPMILIGSSMGGYLALLLAKERVGAIKVIVLAAPAADMTHALMESEINANEEARSAIARDGVWLRPSQYGDPYPITRKLIEGRTQPSPDAARSRSRLSAAHLAWRARPRRALAAWPQETFDAIRSAHAQFILIKDGDHRLSRDQDIVAIERAAENLATDYLASVARSAASPSR